MLSIYDSLTRSTRPFEPLQPGKVSLYVCGQTVYDAPHLGHARKEIGFDIVVRWLEASGYDVTYREFDGPHTVPPEIARGAVDWFLKRPVLE